MVIRLTLLIYSFFIEFHFYKIFDVFMFVLCIYIKWNIRSGKMKKSLLCLLIVLLWNPVVLAQNDKNAYVVSQDIPTYQIDSNTCIELLRQAHMQEDQTLELKDIDLKIDEFKQELESINQQILEIESGSDESIASIEQKLSDIVDQIIADLSENYPDFDYLSEDEQLALISQDTTYQEWQNYLMTLENEKSKLLEEKTSIEQAIEQLNYDKSTVEEQSDLNQKEDYNQCLILPYAMKYYNPDQLPEIDYQVSLGDFIVQMSGIIEKVVPKAYSQLKYEDIFNSYQNLLLSQPEQNSTDFAKTPIQMDESSLGMYNYAKELNLSHIRQLTKMAYQDYQEDPSIESFQHHYLNSLQIKNEQFIFFEAINTEVIDWIKIQLCEYLNYNQLWDETTYAKIKQLQEKYQVKFVWLNRDAQQWQAYPVNHSGFYQEYMEMTFETEEKNIQQKDESTNEMDKNINPGIFDKKLKNKTNKNNLKDKLLHDRTKAKGKTVSSNQETTKEKSLKEHFSLPKTGENIVSMYIGLGMVMSAGLLTYYYLLKQTK